MDIRGPRLRKPSERALAFTSSMAADGSISRHVIAVNVAHMAALVDAGEVGRADGAKIMQFLLGASSEVPRDVKAEDFHQLLEQEAVDALGVETAGYLNYGKSRNDQVATAIRMELRRRLQEILAGIAHLQQSILGLVAKQGTTLIPGYTHLQRAQPVTLAHHFFAYFDSFQRDSERLLQLYSRVNASPMGAAAMAGTSVRVDRRSVARSLGFATVVPNALDAVSARDLAVESLACATMTMLDASRLAEELILWSSVEYGFIEIDDSFAASSSIMPQKKNPVAAEMVRAKAGSVVGDLMAACVILKALPYSYNLDLQEVTPQLWRALDDTSDSLAVLTGMVETLTVKPEVMIRAVQNDNSTAVALANHLVKEHRLSFRQAHSIVGSLVRTSAETGSPLRAVVPSRIGSVSAKFGKRVFIDASTAEKILAPRGFLESIVTEGGSNPRFARGGLRARRRELDLTKSALARMKSSLRASERRLNATASGIAREVK